MLAKKIALGFGIAIIFPMMINYGVATFYPRPSFQELHEYGKLDDKSQENPESKKYLEDFEEKQTRFEMKLLYVSVPLGLIAITAGALLPIQAISTGLLFGGIISICNGYFNYWTKMTDTIKFISLLIGFIVLITVGYIKLDKEKK